MKYLYLLEAQLGFIKIGYSEDPEKRQLTFAAASPCPVRLIAKWPGGFAEEQQLHAAFIGLRRHNEWFALEGALAVFVDAVRGRGVSHILDWPELTWEKSRQRGRESCSQKQKAIRSDPSWKAEQADNRAWRKAHERLEAELGRRPTYQELRQHRKELGFAPWPFDEAA